MVRNFTQANERRQLLFGRPTVLIRAVLIPAKTRQPENPQLFGSVPSAYTYLIYKLTMHTSIIVHGDRPVLCPPSVVTGKNARREFEP